MEENNIKPHCPYCGASLYTNDGKLFKCLCDKTEGFVGTKEMWKALDTSSNIYKLKLHQSTNVDTPCADICVTRVPGGWIYNCFYSEDVSTTVCFVPYSKEFDPYSKEY